MKTTDIYKKLYCGKLKNIDKNLSVFIAHKIKISKQNNYDPAEYEY